MNSLNSLLDHVGGLPTSAVQTSAHTFHTNVPSIGGGNVAAQPTELLVSDPALLSASRCNPHLGSAFAVLDTQRPLGIQFKNIGVTDKFSAQGVNDLNHLLVQHKFGFNPNKVTDSCQKDRSSKFKNVLLKVGDKKDAIYGVKKDQYKGHTSPRKITSWSKSFIHSTSIAGETK